MELIQEADFSYLTDVCDGACPRRLISDVWGFVKGRSERPERLVFLRANLPPVSPIRARTFGSPKELDELIDVYTRVLTMGKSAEDVKAEYLAHPQKWVAKHTEILASIISNLRVAAEGTKCWVGRANSACDSECLDRTCGGYTTCPRLATHFAYQWAVSSREAAIALLDDWDTEMSHHRIGGSKHILYRHFDEDGTLLYVGKTSRPPMQRLSEHVRNSDWSRRIATVRFERFENAAALARAEREAIQTEGPLFNTAHSRRRT